MMGFLGGVLKFALRWTLLLGAFALVLLLIPGLPPYCKFTNIQLSPTLPRERNLAPNNALDNAKKLKENELHGPEAFQVHNNALYTTLGSGEVVKITPGGHVTIVTKIGLPCEGLWQEHKCGRPLGFRIDDAGKYLYVADAYYGIWKVDLETDTKQLLVAPGVAIEGVIPKLFNSLALAKNGDLYWTDSSADFQLRDGSYTTLVDPSGRIFHYNAAKNQSRVLINSLWFANGVALSPNEDFVIINECLASRVHRIYVSGPKTGQKDIFLDGIPGLPDNIQPLSDGSGVLIGLYKVFDEQHPMISRSTARFPLLRKFLARVLRLIEIPFEYLNKLFPNSFFEKVIHHVGHFTSIAVLTPKASGIIRVDWNGKIVDAWFNQDGTVGSISDAIVFQDTLYLGSPHNAFIATTPAPKQLKAAFKPKVSSPKIQEQKKEVPVMQPKPTEPPALAKTAKTVKETPKPVHTKSTTEKPVAAKPSAKPAAAIPVTENPKFKPTTGSPVQEKPTQAKPAVDHRKPAIAPKSDTLKESLMSKQQKLKEDKQKPDQIPIVEEIKVDTALPAKESLKVIKRDGPAEIHHPEL